MSSSTGSRNFPWSASDVVGALDSEPDVHLPSALRERDFEAAVSGLFERCGDGLCARLRAAHAFDVVLFDGGNAYEQTD